ncbi:hypothetical protein B0T11DRAFT_340700 [Plectosphaerella cucumerina]|uniref:ribonuclease H n=1 Tax=Plectosphaerella cucumerina TaxID=40658 RepID=A0A8K0X172_9PEZI|nr:hypothetical protein B0T11DRAFT_340700 [Plectosphaerella cucumerina]
MPIWFTGFARPGLETPPSCLYCHSNSSLFPCDGCKAVSYCGAARQKDDRSRHKSYCNAIRNTRETLEREEAALWAQPGDMFITSVGDFWGVLGTRNYMRARFAAANALLQIHTIAAGELALAHFKDMMRLNRSDDMGVRNIIPPLLLRLDKEQECYDFLKQQARMDVRGTTSCAGADIFESVDFLSSKNRPLSLSQLVSFTLLKLRLYLDLSGLKLKSENGCSMRANRFAGKLANARFQALLLQYLKLGGIVHEANPHFWKLLVDESVKTPAAPASHVRGSIEEARLALYHCRQSWKDTEDAITTLAKDAAAFATVHRPAVTASSHADINALEKKRGTGRAFPSRIVTDPVFLPDVMSTACVGHSQTDRFICLYDPNTTIVYTDGACTNNGQPNSRGGWAVIQGPVGPSSCSVVLGRLEDRGPFGDKAVATSNRAELRAVIGALRMCDWRSEGFDGILIATDSSYVVNDATEWALTWLSNGLVTQSGNAVMNRDLWELLLGEVERWFLRGLRVMLWSIPRELNVDADRAAKRAAQEEPQPVFRDIFAKATVAVEEESEEESLPMLGSLYMTFVIGKNSLATAVLMQKSVDTSLNNRSEPESGQLT